MPYQKIYVGVREGFWWAFLEPFDSLTVTLDLVGKSPAVQ